MTKTRLQFSNRIVEKGIRICFESFNEVSFLFSVLKIKVTTSAEALAQKSPVQTDLHSTRRGFFRFSAIAKAYKISQQAASVISKERLQIKHSPNFPKMNSIQTDENSFLNSPTVFEKVGPMISNCFSSTRACAWGVNLLNVVTCLSE